MDLFLLLIAGFLASAGIAIFVAAKAMQRQRETTGTIWGEIILAGAALIVAGAVLAAALDLAVLRRSLAFTGTVAATFAGGP